MRMEQTAALVCAIVLAITCFAYADSGNSVCLSPPDVAGAIIPEFTVTEHPIGTAVIYNCPPGYASLNLTNQISLCRNNTANGKAEWTLPNIACKRNSVCSSPPDVDGAVTPQFKASEHAVGTAVIYNCPSNYVSLNVTDLISLCTINTENGKAEWTPPKMSCETRCYLTDLKNKDHVSTRSESFTFSGDRINIVCDEGYSPKSKKMPLCLNGSWQSDSEPLCEASGCEIPKTARGSLKEEKYGDWQFQWDWFNSHYKRVIHYEVFQPGSTVPSDKLLWFYCDKPYSVNGKGKDRVQTRCLRGKWSTELQCLLDVMCEEPQPPKHGTVKLHGDLKVGSLATYSCDSGRKLNGDNTAVCLISGQWTFDAPECLSVAECVLDLGPFPRLLVNPMKDVYRVGETISLSCPPGEVMSSQVYRIMCLPSGWTDSFPNCIKLNKEP